jgi:FlaG/FlaF family flagellin (archaellin)
MNEKYRLPLVALIALAVVAVVVAAIVGLGSLGSTATSAAPTPSASLTPTAIPAPTPTDPRSTPEGATRAFFVAFSQARKTNDPSLVEPYVTSKDSGAYLTASGFLGGAQGVNRASIVTVDRLDKMTSQVTGDTATVDFDYTEGGYDINPSTGAALESPTVLPPIHVTATLKLVNGLWLMDSYVTHQ